MAKLEIMIHENTGATKESAPYLGTFVTKDTTKLEALAALVSRKSGLPAIQTLAILKGAFDEFMEMERDAPTRINFDGGYVCQVIRGTFESSDAAFNPAVNSLELAFRLADDVKNFLVDATPRIVTDETSTKVRVDNVADVETPRPYQVIHGQHVFKVTGINLVTTDVGAAVWLENNLGVTFPCTVQSVISKQEFTAKSAALLEGGDYKLWVKSRGGDAEGPLQTSFRKVKYLKIVDPVLREITITEAHATTEYVDFHAANLDGVEGYGKGDDTHCNVYLKLNGGEETLAVGTGSPESEDPLLLVVYPAGWTVAAGDTVTLTLKPNPAKADIKQVAATGELTVG